MAFCFPFPTSGVLAVPICCVVLGWRQTATLFYPGARRRLLDMTEWINFGKLMPGYSRQQELHTDQLLRQHSQLTVGQMVGYLPKTSSWEVLTYKFWACVSCLSWTFCTVILPLILWSDLLSRVCTLDDFAEFVYSHRFLTRFSQSPKHFILQILIQSV